MIPGGEPVGAGVICHAHPLHGGIMHHQVVFRAARALQGQGLPALRFNFRGAGLSEGAHDGGRGEQDDVRAVLDELDKQFPGVPLILGGYSFGSVMALLAGIGDPRVRALFALGFPVDFISDTSFLEACHKPTLFVQGQNDEFGSGEQVETLADRLPTPPSVVVVPGADHFFTDRLDPLEEAIGQWVGKRPWA